MWFQGGSLRLLILTFIRLLTSVGTSGAFKHINRQFLFEIGKYFESLLAPLHIQEKPITELKPTLKKARYKKIKYKNKDTKVLKSYKG